MSHVSKSAHSPSAINLAYMAWLVFWTFVTTTVSFFAFCLVEYETCRYNTLCPKKETIFL